MPISISRLRLWIVAVAALMVLIVAGFYVHARLQVRRVLKEVAPARLEKDVQQSSEGFSFSKSEGGHTLFTIRASQAVQYASSDKATLKDVTIVVFGRRSNRFDQIYGSDFEYDPRAGIVAARGEVHIDLQGNAEGLLSPDQTPPRELRNPIHLMTTGLVFDQKTGIARVEGVVEFRVPQATGRARGATYDSHTNELTFDSQVDVQLGHEKVTSLHAARGKVTKDPRSIILADVVITQEQRKITGQQVRLDLTDANDIERAVLTGNVALTDASPSGLAVHAPQGELFLGENNTLRTALFTGGVRFSSQGSNPAEGDSEKLQLNFGGNNRVQQVVASDHVRLRQMPSGAQKNRQQAELACDQLTMDMAGGARLHHGGTGGAAQLTLTPLEPRVPGEHAIITAQQIQADFDDQGRIARMRGEPDSRIVAVVPGEPDKVSSGRRLTVNFAPGGGVADVIQEGNVRYEEATAVPHEAGGRKAFGERARYSPDDDSLTLTGSPRVQDGGMTLTADSIRFNRHTGEAFAQGSVKTTYSELRPDPNGALLAGGEPVHVTARAASMQRKSSLARYSGGARLWQGMNAIEAPAIEFNQQRRSMVAEGTAEKPVISVFAQPEIGNKSGNGKGTTVVVRATHLSYLDSERRARYTGDVRATGNGMVLTAGLADILLQPAGQKGEQSGPSQLDQIIAQEGVILQQGERRASGDRLVYTAASGTFVLTGGPPQLVDPAQGTVRGDSLTFYRADDRVVVESSGSSRTFTQTHISR